MLRQLSLALAIACLSLSALHAQANPIPERMWPVNTSGYDLVNILLLGMGSYSDNGLTDAMMILSLNRTTRTAAILSIPRDLYVYVLGGYGMRKLNQVYYLVNRDGRDGLLWLKETILYNLGVTIHHHVRTNFSGFAALVDALGGIDISVDCALQDWKLKAPDLDRANPENWERFTLDVGVHRLDGATALWYARSRMSSNDFDRGRRHQDLLRAIWRRVRQANWLADIPRLWQMLSPYVQTDITLDQALSFLPLALEMEANGLSYYTFTQGQEVTRGYTDGEGQFILNIQRAPTFALMQAFVTPPTASQFRALRPTVAVINESGAPNLARVAADRLELEGFIVTLLGDGPKLRRYNKIVDHVGAEKGNPLPILQRTLRVTDQGVEIAPDANRAYDYTVYVGALYASFACTRPVLPPS
ncbi:MAG: LCP family protein [Anaerolineae bacterium]|nr:LCP family protein [Anaerolineae bacterium]MDW8171296.1 LCP family protein [Anaerolineae bacterium]